MHQVTEAISVIKGKTQALVSDWNTAGEVGLLYPSCLTLARSAMISAVGKASRAHLMQGDVLKQAGWAPLFQIWLLLSWTGGLDLFPSSSQRPQSCKVLMPFVGQSIKHKTFQIIQYKVG